MILNFVVLDVLPGRVFPSFAQACYVDTNFPLVC